jgi:hypothetical protein
MMSTKGTANTTIREGHYEVSRDTGDPAVVYYLDTQRKRAEFLRFTGQGSGVYTVVNEKYLGTPDEAAHTYHLTPDHCACKGSMRGVCYHRRTLRLSLILAQRSRPATGETARANALLAAANRLQRQGSAPDTTESRPEDLTPYQVRQVLRARSQDTTRCEIATY